MSEAKPSSKDTQPQAEPIFVTEKVAAYRTSLLKLSLHRWAKKARTPNGWPLVVKRASDSDEFLIDERSVKRLENRFVYASSGGSAGPRSFNPHQQLHGPRTHFKYDDAKLIPLEEAFKSFEKQFGNEKAATFRTWCLEESGPGKNKMRPIRDSVTTKLYIGERSLSIAQAAIRLMR